MSSLGIQKRKLLRSLAEMGLFHRRNGLGRYLKDLNTLKLEKRAFSGERARRKGMGKKNCSVRLIHGKRKEAVGRQGWNRA